METNFFTALTSLSTHSNWIITMKKLDDAGNWVMSVSMNDPSLKDEAAKGIIPKLLRGKAADFDAMFFDTLTAPIQKTDNFFANLKEVEKNAEEQSKQTRLAQSEQDKERKQKQERATKVNDVLKKVNELQKEEKYGEAIGKLQTLDPQDYPEHTAQLATKLEELKKLHSSPKLF